MFMVRIGLLEPILTANKPPYKNQGMQIQLKLGIEWLESQKTRVCMKRDMSTMAAALARL
jgi:phage tail tube protein FII